MEINPKPSLISLGGKGYQLTKLMQSFNVPSFFVVSFENPNEILDAKTQKAILEQYYNQNLDIVAVRSSASIEDSEHTSFAGMFETILNVPYSELISAIKLVLESMHDIRVSKYCEIHGIEKNNIRMNVIIQKMVKSKVSGVCFTRTVQTNQLVIEACYGLGEALVSGKLTPDTYMIDRDTLRLISESIGYQKVELKIDENNPGRTSYSEIPFHKRNAKKLTIDQILGVAKMSLLVERQLGFDATDVEWAFEGNNLFLLQARPYAAYTNLFKQKW